MSPPALMATFVPPLTVVPVSLLLPSMRELRLLQRMLSDWPVVTLSRFTLPLALSSTLPPLVICAPRGIHAVLAVVTTFTFFAANTVQAVLGIESSSQLSSKQWPSTFPTKLIGLWLFPPSVEILTSRSGSSKD